MSEGAAPNPEPGPEPYRYRGGACSCARCRCRGLLGPVVLITVGAVFLIPQFVERLSISHLWPIILIAIGLVKLLESTASTEGHRG